MKTCLRHGSMPMAAMAAGDDSVLWSARAAFRLRRHDSTVSASEFARQLTVPGGPSPVVCARLRELGITVGDDAPSRWSDDQTYVNRLMRSVADIDSSAPLDRIPVGNGVAAYRLPTSGWLAVWLAWRRLFVLVGRPGGACLDCAISRIRSACRYRAIASADMDEIFGPTDSIIIPEPVLRITREAIRFLGWHDPASTSLLRVRYARNHPRVNVDMVIGRPDCRCTLGTSAISRSVETPLTSLQRLRVLVSPAVGLIARTRVDREHTAPTLSAVRTESSVALKRPGGPVLKVGGAAVRTDPTAAEIAAIAEAAERYAAAAFPLARVRYAPGAQLRNALFPSAFNSRMLNKDHEIIGWLEGSRALSGEPVFVPAAMTLLAYPRREAELTMQPTSHGLAAGLAPTMAASRGLLERIERDAWERHWRNPDKARTIQLRPCCRDFTEALAAVSSARHVLSRHVLSAHLITKEIPVPVVLAVSVTRMGGRPMVAIGLKASGTIHDAAIGALLECHQSQILVRDLLNRRAIPASSWDITDMIDHYLFYCDESRLGVLAALMTGQSSTLPVRCVSGGIRYPDIVHAVRDTGCDVVHVDLTTSDLRSIGVYVCKTLTPGLLETPYGRAAAIPANPTAAHQWWPRPGG